MIKKNKMLSLALAISSVTSVGFAGAFSSFAAYNEDQLNQMAANLLGIDNAVEQAKAAGLTTEDIDKLVECVKDDGTIDTSSLPIELKTKTAQVLKTNGYSYTKNSNGSYELKQGDKSIISSSADIVKEQLQEIKKGPETVVPISTGGSSSGSSDFVSGKADSSLPASSEGVVETSLPVVQAYKLDKVTHETKIDLAKMVEKMKDSKTPSAVTLEVENAKWTIESKDLDNTKVQGFVFNPGVTSTSVEKSSVSIPEEVKTLSKGKNNVVISFSETANKELPFNAKVTVKLGTQYANKKMDVYYIVDGKSYKAGNVIIGKDGQVICSFKLIGSFVLVEA